jgi:hypothetical protein
MHRKAFVSVCYICSRAREWNSPGTRVVDRNRAHTYKKGAAQGRARRQRAAAQPSSKGRPDVRPSFISTHLVFRPQTLPPHTPPPYHRSLHPGPDSTYVSALQHRAPRDLSGNRPRSTGRPSHLFSAAGTSRVEIPLRPPRSPAVAFALRPTNSQFRTHPYLRSSHVATATARGGLLL